MNPAKLRLRLQPYVSLLALRYPVDDLLLEVRKDSDDLDVASNTFNERHKRKRVSAVAKLKPSPIFLAVHRLDEDVYFRRLDREEFAILSALHAGKPLNAAIESALRSSPIAAADRAAHVEKWFHTWSALGWFCRLEKSSKIAKAACAEVSAGRKRAPHSMSKPGNPILRMYDGFVKVVSALQSPFLLLVRVYWGWQLSQNGWAKIAQPAESHRFFLEPRIARAARHSYFRLDRSNSSAEFCWRSACSRASPLSAW